MKWKMTGGKGRSEDVWSQLGSLEICVSVICGLFCDGDIQQICRVLCHISLSLADVEGRQLLQKGIIAINIDGFRISQSHFLSFSVRRKTLATNRHKLYHIRERAKAEQHI